MPSINLLRLGSGWTTEYLNQTAGGLVVRMTGGGLSFDFGAGGTGGTISQEAQTHNGDDYWNYLIGTAGPWDFSTGDLVFHNAEWPDWTHVEGGAVPDGGLRFGVVLYNVQDTDAGNWEIDWGVEVVYSGGVIASGPHTQTFLVNETGAYSLVDPAINGGGSSPYENIGGFTGPTSIPTPIEMYTWLRLRSAGGLIFYETSHDGVTWSYVHGSAGSAPDLGGSSLPMSDLMRSALTTVGVMFYVVRTPGYGSGTWTVDRLNTAPYTVAAGDPASPTVWVSYGYNAAGQTGRGEFGPTSTGLGTDEPLPAQVLFPNDVDVAQLAVGSNQSAAVSADGHIYVWGDCLLDVAQGFFGDQLVPPFAFDPTVGDPPNAERAIAIPTLLEYAEATDVMRVEVGVSALFWVRTDNTVWGVGLNASGEFGTGSTGEYFGVPHQIDPGVGVVWLAACRSYPGLFCVGTDGRAYFAGDDLYWMSGGAVGSDQPPNTSGGDDVLQLSFAQVPFVTDITKLSATGQTALAIAQYGSTWIWGADLSGTSDISGPPVAGGITRPYALLAAAGSLVTAPFVTVSSTSGLSVGHWSPTNTSLTLTSALTIEPPLPTPP